MLTLPIKRLIEWLRSGNNCEKCACSWAEQGYDDWDCGCNIKGADYDEKRCYLVLPIRWLLLRRAKYYADHQYDGIEEWYKKSTSRNKCAKPQFWKRLEFSNYIGKIKMVRLTKWMWIRGQIIMRGKFLRLANLNMRHHPEYANVGNRCCMIRS